MLWKTDVASYFQRFNIGLFAQNRNIYILISGLDTWFDYNVKQKQGVFRRTPIRDFILC